MGRTFLSDTFAFDFDLARVGRTLLPDAFDLDFDLARVGRTLLSDAFDLDFGWSRAFSPALLRLLCVAASAAEVHLVSLATAGLGNYSRHPRPARQSDRRTHVRGTGSDGPVF